jgi:hypothetical protein
MTYIMCARTFPAYHPRAGQPTGFRQAILDGRKIHTLRQSAGTKRSGETVSLREWAGRPYGSRQVEFARCEIEVASVSISNGLPDQFRVQEMARNDGFADAADFCLWFSGGRARPVEFAGVCIWFRGVRPADAGASIPGGGR